MVIDFAGDLGAILGGGDSSAVSGSYAQGANTKSITTARRHAPVTRAGPPGELDEARTEFLIAASEFSTGFSASSPVVPSAGDIFTVDGVVWTVDGPEMQGAESFWLLPCSRRIQRGAS